MMYRTTPGVPPSVLDIATDRATMLNELTGRLVDLLQNEGIDEPLDESLTLACVLADLYAVARVPVPAWIAAKIHGPDHEGVQTRQQRHEPCRHCDDRYEERNH